MADLHRYNIWCETCSPTGSYIEEWAETEPTNCPNNDGHSITSSKTYINSTVTDPAPLEWSVTNSMPPTASTMSWYDTDGNQAYIFDRGRGKWLSLERRTFTFAYNKGADNVKMRIHGLHHGDLGYLMPKKATVVAVFGSATKGEKSKYFTIDADDTEVYELKMEDYRYKNTNLNVDVDEDVILSMSVGKDGKKIENPVVCIEVAWRYN